MALRSGRRNISLRAWKGCWSFPRFFDHGRASLEQPRRRDSRPILPLGRSDDRRGVPPEASRQFPPRSAFACSEDCCVKLATRTSGDSPLWKRSFANGRGLSGISAGAVPSGSSSWRNGASKGCERAGKVIQIGLAPNRIDILTTVSGLPFEEAWGSSIPSRLDGVRVRFPSRSSLLANKRASGRSKDLADVEELERRAGGQE